MKTIMEGKYGKSKIEKRIGFYTNKIYHSNIEFFNIDTLAVLCQGEGLTYSNENHKGTIISTYENIYSKFLSAILIEESYQNIFKLLLSLLIHIERNIISDKIKGSNNFYEILDFVNTRISEINMYNKPSSKNIIKDKEDKDNCIKEKEVFKYTNIPYSIKTTSKTKNCPEIFYNILESDEYISGPKTDFEMSIHEKIDMPNIYPLFINPISSTYNPYWKNGLDSKMALMDPETVALLTKEIPSNKYIKQIKSFQKMQTREKNKYIKDIKKNDKLKSKGQIKMFFNKAEEILTKKEEKKKEEEERAKQIKKQQMELEKDKENEKDKQKTNDEIESDILNRLTSSIRSSSNDLDYKSQSSVINNINFSEDQYEINSTSILNLIHDKNNYDSNSYSDLDDSDSDSKSELNNEDEDDLDDEYDSESNMLNDYFNDDNENDKDDDNKDDENNNNINKGDDENEN